MLKKLIPNDEAWKIIAIISMTCDHVNKYLLNNSYPLLSDVLGRAAFPIFTYLIVLNLNRGANPNTYLARLTMFGIASTPIFYMVERYFLPLNILFALAISVLAISLTEFGFRYYPKIPKSITALLVLLILVPLSSTVIYLVPFYVMIFYWWFHKGSVSSLVSLMLMAALINSNNGTAALFSIIWTLAIALSAGKNLSGKRYLKPWWLFYTYFPLHLLIIYILKIYVMN